MALPRARCRPSPATRPVAYDGAPVTVDLVLSRTGGLEGTLEADQTPLARVPVLVISRQEDGSVQPHQVYTDAQGRWRLDGLAPGTYHLKAGRGVDAFDVSGALTVRVEPGRVVTAPVLRLP